MFGIGGPGVLFGWILVAKVVVVVVSVGLCKGPNTRHLDGIGALQRAPIHSVTSRRNGIRFPMFGIGGPGVLFGWILVAKDVVVIVSIGALKRALIHQSITPRKWVANRLCCSQMIFRMNGDSYEERWKKE